MPENEANKANFEELMGHVTILKARLENTMNAVPSQQNQTVDDLFDYYERAVSDRVMRNNTLTEELGAAQREIRAHERRQFVVFAGIAIIAVLVLVVGALVLFPHTISGVRKNPVVTHIVAAIASAAVAALLTMRNRTRAAVKRE